MKGIPRCHRLSYGAAVCIGLAASVRQALIDLYHIDGARMTTAGLGATKPAAPNTTPEGRQQNWRVELVKK